MFYHYLLRRSVFKTQDAPLQLYIIDCDFLCFANLTLIALFEKLIFIEKCFHVQTLQKHRTFTVLGFNPVFILHKNSLFHLNYRQKRKKIFFKIENFILKSLNQNFLDEPNLGFPMCWGLGVVLSLFYSKFVT